MSREIKRVPSNFAPPKGVWFGYVLPSIPCELCHNKTFFGDKECKLCEGEGIVFPRVEVPEGKAY